jgi:hypothetical protein
MMNITESVRIYFLILQRITNASNGEEYTALFFELALLRHD